MVSLTCTALLDIQKMAFEKERRELLEAAEFEARVAALIAKLYADKFADVVLKHARLQVEEEMNEC